MSRCALCNQVIDDDDSVMATAAGSCHEYCLFDCEQPPPQSHIRGIRGLAMATLYGDPDPMRP